MEEQMKTLTTNDNLMEEFLKLLKRELIRIFSDRTGQFEYETGWVYLASTAGWQQALENASGCTVPAIYKLWKMLNWEDSEGLDNWIIDCAVAHGIIKPMFEDPEFK